jgi:hypothetical protein
MMDLLRCGRPNDVARQCRSPYFVQNGDSASQVLWSVLQDIGWDLGRSCNECGNVKTMHMFLGHQNACNVKVVMDTDRDKSLS